MFPNNHRPLVPFSSPTLPLATGAASHGPMPRAHSNSAPSCNLNGAPQQPPIQNNSSTFSGPGVSGMQPGQFYTGISLQNCSAVNYGSVMPNGSQTIHSQLPHQLPANCSMGFTHSYNQNNALPNGQFYIPAPVLPMNHIYTTTIPNPCQGTPSRCQGAFYGVLTNQSFMPGNPNYVTHITNPQNSTSVVTTFPNVAHASVGHQVKQEQVRSITWQTGLHAQNNLATFPQQLQGGIPVVSFSAIQNQPIPNCHPSVGPNPHCSSQQLQQSMVTASTGALQHHPISNSPSVGAIQHQPLSNYQPSVGAFQHQPISNCPPQVGVLHYQPISNCQPSVGTIQHHPISNCHQPSVVPLQHQSISNCPPSVGAIQHQPISNCQPIANYQPSVGGFQHQSISKPPFGTLQHLPISNCHPSVTINTQGDCVPGVIHTKTGFTNPPRNGQRYSSARKAPFRYNNNRNGRGGSKGFSSVDGGDESNEKQERGKFVRRVNYTAEEVQSWREERRRNYPTKANIERKLIQKKNNDEAVMKDAELRCQQLREVLAKQAELGCEVAEIPEHYFLPRGGENRRRGRRNDAAAYDVKREESLLRKLLGEEMKRDAKRLRQVLRFITLNSFFKDWNDPDRAPLSFPLIQLPDNPHDSEEGEIIDS